MDHTFPISAIVCCFAQMNQTEKNMIIGAIDYSVVWPNKQEWNIKYY